MQKKCPNFPFKAGAHSCSQGLDPERQKQSERFLPESKANVLHPEKHYQLISTLPGFHLFRNDTMAILNKKPMGIHNEWALPNSFPWCEIVLSTRNHWWLPTVMKKKAPACIFNRPFFFESQQISLCLWPARFRNWKQCWCNSRYANAAGRGKIQRWQRIKERLQQSWLGLSMRWQQTTAIHLSHWIMMHHICIISLLQPLAGRWDSTHKGAQWDRTHGEDRLHNDKDSCRDTLSPICINFMIYLIYYKIRGKLHHPNWN